MSIFTINQDYDYFEIDLNVLDIVDSLPESFDLSNAARFTYENISLAKRWPNLKTTFFDSGEILKTPGVSRWLEGTLLLSPVAKALASGFLAHFGEFLKITIDDQEWYIFNCLTMVTPTKIASNGTVTFNQSDIQGKAIFKAMVGEDLGFFCQDRFKLFLEEYEFKGLQINNTFLDIDTGIQRMIEAV